QAEHSFGGVGAVPRTADQRDLAAQSDQARRRVDRRLSLGYTARMKNDPAIPTCEAPITSIQPGRGLCFSLELAPGPVPRPTVRPFFPGHVRRFLALRQGECSGCPHDIIDPRDLKPYRNVCGFFFRPEDDPYAWRGRIGLARPGLAELVCFSLLLAPLV